MVLITHGTEWPILCWCAVKQLLTHSHTILVLSKSMRCSPFNLVTMWHISFHNQNLQCIWAAALAWYSVLQKKFFVPFSLTLFKYVKILCHFLWKWILMVTGSRAHNWSGVILSTLVSASLLMVRRCSASAAENHSAVEQVRDNVGGVTLKMQD